MMHADDASAARRGRRRWSVSEKVELVRLTMEPGASIAEIARAHGVNANQVFKWRRQFKKGELRAGAGRATALLPVSISAEVDGMRELGQEAGAEQRSSGGAIHVELPGRANITAEMGTDPALLRCVLESLRK
jgi:transposase